MIGDEDIAMLRLAMDLLRDIDIDIPLPVAAQAQDGAGWDAVDGPMGKPGSWDRHAVNMVEDVDANSPGGG